MPLGELLGRDGSPAQHERPQPFEGSNLLQVFVRELGSVQFHHLHSAKIRNLVAVH